MSITGENYIGVARSCITSTTAKKFPPKFRVWGIK